MILCDVYYIQRHKVSVKCNIILVRAAAIDSIAVVSVLHHQVAPACLALMGQRPLFLRAVELLFPVMHLRLSTLHF